MELSITPPFSPDRHWWVCCQQWWLLSGVCERPPWSEWCCTWLSLWVSYWWHPPSWQPHLYPQLPLLPHWWGPLLLLSPWLPGLNRERTQLHRYRGSLKVIAIYWSYKYLSFIIYTDFFFTVDINECLNASACGLNFDCINNDGSFLCYCGPGFYRDEGLCGESYVYRSEADVVVVIIFFSTAYVVFLLLIRSSTTTYCMIALPACSMSWWRVATGGWG